MAIHHYVLSPHMRLQDKTHLDFSHLQNDELPNQNTVNLGITVKTEVLLPLDKVCD